MKGPEESRHRLGKRRWNQSSAREGHGHRRVALRFTCGLPAGCASVCPGGRGSSRVGLGSGTQASNRPSDAGYLCFARTMRRTSYKRPAQCGGRDSGASQRFAGGVRSSTACSESAFVAAQDSKHPSRAQTRNFVTVTSAKFRFSGQGPQRSPGFLFRGGPHRRSFRSAFRVAPLPVCLNLLASGRSLD
jgi:hypothetical protein